MTSPHLLGGMPTDWNMTTIDELLVKAPLSVIFNLSADVQRWPIHLAHYRYVRFLERRSDGGGLVEMSANRPFGVANWPTHWTSLMSIATPDSAVIPAIRFRHVRGVTTGMEVEWSFVETNQGTDVRITHVWNGPEWPVVGSLAARGIIGPVFIHGIASRTLAGLARAAERMATDASQIEVSRG